MTAFFDLSQAIASAGQPEGSLAHSQKKADDAFPSVVATSPFRLWRPGDLLPATGKRLLIGVATWSAYDMKLLDAVSQALQRLPSGLRVEVFNVADCSSPEAFDHYVPGIGSVFHTPVVGLWADGQLVEKATGRAGRELVARVSGLDALQVDGLIATIKDAP
jgi:hypothetical protein